MDPRLAEPVIPTAVLAGVVEIGQQHHRAVETWFSGTGLTTDQLVDPDMRLSFRQITTILKRALRDLPAGPVGLQVGGRDALISFGVLGLAVRSCSTGAEAFTVGLELQQASGSLTDPEAEYFESRFALRLRERAPEPDLLPFLCEEAFGSTLLLVRSVLGADVLPERLELAYPQPAHAAAVRSFFRCPIRFDADANRMWLSSELLDRPIATADPTIRAMAMDACRRMIDTGEHGTDTVRAVETLLGRNLRRPLTMNEVAALLYVTERTLRRQLHDAGQRFSDIRDRVRERRATFLLRSSALPVHAVAQEVGFSDPREFRRAYIRWTGHPPTAAR